MSVNKVIYALATRMIWTPVEWKDVINPIDIKWFYKISELGTDRKDLHKIIEDPNRGVKKQITKVLSHLSHTNEIALLILNITSGKPMSKKAGTGIVEGAIFLQGWDQRGWTKQWNIISFIKSYIKSFWNKNS